MVIVVVGGGGNDEMMIVQPFSVEWCFFFVVNCDGGGVSPSPKGLEGCRWGGTPAALA